MTNESELVANMNDDILYYTIHYPAEFSSNPSQPAPEPTHQGLGRLESSRLVWCGKLELNSAQSAGQWPSRTGFGTCSV